MTVKLHAHWIELNTTSTLGPGSKDKMLGYRKETALQGALVLTKSGRLELEYNILRTL